MMRVFMLLLILVTLFVQDVEVHAVETGCNEWNYAVVDTPVNTKVKVKPCAMIATAPETIVYIGDNYEALTIRFDDRNISGKELLFRVGSDVGKYEILCAGNCSDYREATIRITDVPGHIKGGESALFYASMEQEGGKWHKLRFLRDYPLQVMIPRGHDIRLQADARITVKYANTKTEIEPEKEIHLKGEPGIDLVEIRSFDMDGDVKIASFSKRQPKKHPTKSGTNKTKNAM